MSQSTERRATRPALPAGLAQRVLAASIVAAFGAAPGLALAQLPTGAEVVRGTAQITSGEGQMTIVNSANAVLNWQSFSVGTGNGVHFEQPSAASKVLNRVVGNDPSSILGSLSSNGEVWLVNPHGVLFGNEARIDVGGLVASTLGVTNNDFLAGRNRFGVTGTQGGDVLNQSDMKTSFGGRVWMIGGAVRNEGAIETSGGQIVLAAGESVDLVDSGMPNVTVRVRAPENEAVNLGSLMAPSGGSIDVHGAIVNQSGIVRADSAGSDAAGRIILRAQGDVRLGAGSYISASAIGNNGVHGGSVLVESVAGEASIQGEVLATSAHSRGGVVQVLGREIDVGRDRDTLIAVWGGSGGGTVRIGDNTGLEAPRARHTDVNALIDASADDDGDGGTIVVASDGSTRVSGALYVNGGANGSGTGGWIETSGTTLDASAAVNLWGRAGSGTWQARAGSMTVGASGPAVVHRDMVSSALGQGARVALQARDIVIAADIDASDMAVSSAALELAAQGNIVVNPGVTIRAGQGGLAVTLVSDLDGNGAGAIGLGQDVTIDTSGGALRLAGGAAGGRAERVDVQGSRLRAGNGNLSIAGQIVDISASSELLAGGIDIKGQAIRLADTHVNAYRESEGEGEGEGNTDGIAITANTLALSNADMYTTGTVRLSGAASVALENSEIISQAYGDAIVLSSASLTGANSPLEATNGRRLFYLDTLDAMFAASYYTGSGTAFIQVGATADTEPVLSGAGKDGVIVREGLDVRVSVDATRTYDGTTRATFSRALSDNLGPQFLLQGNDRTVEGQFADKHAGSGKTIAIEGAQPLYGIVTSTGQAVYGARQTYVADITPRTISASNLAAADKIYDATRNAAVSGTLSGIIDGDRVSLEGATGLFADKHAGNDKLVTISSASLAGADARNYRIDSATVLADITPRTLGADGLTALGKVYDGSRAATVSGALAGILEGDSVRLDGAIAQFSDRNVGTGKTVTLAGAVLAGADAANYRLGDLRTLQADITPRQVAATNLSAQDKVYDGTRTATWSGALAGIIEGDSVRLGDATAQFADKAAGSGKTVTISGATLAGADAANYRLTALPTVSASITPRALSGASLTVLDKVYDGTRTANLSGALSGIIAGDSVRLDGATGLFDSKQAGIGKTVTLAGGRLAGADAGNYTVSAGATGLGNIAPRPITANGVTALNKVYDGTRSATLAGALSGVLPGDSVSLDNAIGLFSDKDAGTAKTVTISGAALGGADAGNYTLQGAPGVVADITPRAITATGLSALDKVYDGTLAAQLSGALTGVLPNDNVALDATGAFATRHVGTGIAVTITGALRGADAANYALILPTGASASASITHRPLDIVLTGKVSKQYDATLLASLAPDAYLLNGVVAGDSLVVRGPSQGSFDSANVGQAREVRASGLFDISGEYAANYRVGSVNLSGTSNQVEATALGLVGAIVPATLIYEAGAVVSVGGLNVGALGGTVSGFKGADTLASATTGTLQWQTPVNAASRPGTHPVYGSGLTAPNYVFVQAPANAAALTLTPGTQASAPPQRAQEGSNDAIGTALAAVLPPVASGTMDSVGRGAVTDTVGGGDSVGRGAVTDIVGGGGPTQVAYNAPDGAAVDAVGSSADGGANSAAVDSAADSAADTVSVNEAVASAASGGATEQSSKASARIFEPINIAAMERADLEQLLAQRRDFKRKAFADAIYQLAIDPSLADVRPCATVADADSGACRITPAQLALLHAARVQAAPAARNGKARVASVPQIERKIALLVGINAYGDKNIPQLKNAISDADAVGKVFAATLGYDVRVLPNPDKATIIRTLNALAAEAGSEDSVVIYFAGHGYSMEAHGPGYWLASDATVTGDLKGWISNSDVAQMLSGIRSKQVTLISDSCYSGAFASEGLDAVGQNVTVDGVLAKRSVVVLSSGGDEPVPDNGKAGHSIFAWNLMKVLGSVTNWTPGSSVFADVQARVRKEFPQTPKYGSVTAAGHQAGGDYLFESRTN